jgi:hypothetical protein
MTVKKMLVVTLNDTKGVVCAVTRTASGAPPAEDLVGAGLLMRTQDKDNTVTVPATDLKVTEVDYTEDVLRNPLSHVLDDTTQTIFASSSKVTQVDHASGSPTVNVTILPAVGGKSVLVLVDAGASREPIKAVASSDPSGVTKVPVSGVPAGDHLILASADGYAGLLAVKPF